MIQSFTLHQPESLERAASLLAERGEDARVLAGGSELILILKMGLAAPKHIVNIKNIPGLDRLDYDPSSQLLRIGPLVTHRVLEKSPVVNDHFPLIHEMEKQLANVRIRNVGTLAGNLAFAEPHADPGTVLLAYNARVKLSSARRERMLGMGEFFVDYYETAMRSDELLTEIEIPKPAPTASGAYLRFCPGERPMVGAAVLLRWENQLCEGARLALGCVAPTPIRLPELEQWLAGKSREEVLAHIDHLGDQAAAMCQPLEDIWGSVEYKKQIVKTLVGRALTRVCRESDA
jgi:carbon-monoxide dehydrogenase medium subunit